jgi:hypothetical protein
VTKEFVTITFSDKLNVMKSCSSPNHSSDEMKRLGDESCSSQKTIFLVPTNIVQIIKYNRSTLPSLLWVIFDTVLLN